MKFDLNKVIGIANSISNPKQGIGMALNLLAKKSPETASMISGMIKSGENPVQAIQKFAMDGKFSAKELGQVKAIYGMAKKAGFKKFNVPESVWKQAEQAVSVTKTPGGARSANNDDWF